GYAYLSKINLPSHIRVLSAASRTILLCGPSEPYQQSLAKALAHHFDARLLLLDIAEFSRQVSGELFGHLGLRMPFCSQLILNCFLLYMPNADPTQIRECKQCPGS
uniref:Uncharacterized protein n=1 Tax=Aegilops tauschii subsp. strangulata TaxID=200361 RepID=A0A453F2V0_AEGTS